MGARPPWHRWLVLLLLLPPLGPSALIACSEEPSPVAGDSTVSQDDPPAVSSPPGASVSTEVRVPAGMRSAPFDVNRYLVLPPGFSIAVYARIPNARFLAVAPNGDLLVSQPALGRVKLVRSNLRGDPLISDFLAELRRPHDLVFQTIGATTYLYVAEAHQISRYLYQTGDTIGRERQVLVGGLPTEATAGLEYNHDLKNIALGPDHRLYVMIASGCDACVEDTQSNPKRGAIYEYPAEGGTGRLFAQGLRNAEGLAFVPGTSDLWVVVNHQNAIAYPYDDGTGRYGEVIQPYVDDHPPEAFTRVRDGGNYGWPFCNPTHDRDGSTDYDEMPYDPDYRTNRSSHVDCAAMDRLTKGMQAHSAPLGLTFLQGTNFPTAYRQGAVVALHGSGQPRSTRTGAKLIYFPWNNATGLPGAEIDLVAGWITGESYWGRPVDAVVNAEGQMFISDDHSGTIYKLALSP